MPLNEDIIKYDAFIFDFDGVIVDSLAIKAEAFGQLFEDLGIDVMKKVKAHHLSHGGVSRYEKFKHYYRTYRGREITPPESAVLDKQYSDLVVRKVIEADLIPGVMDFLKKIKQSAKFCCVISATPEAEIRHIVSQRGLGEFFQEVLGSPKSKKDILGQVIEKNKLKEELTVYFGDAKSDYEAAQAYGIDFIGVVFSPDGELNNINGIKKIINFLN